MADEENIETETQEEEKSSLDEAKAVLTELKKQNKIMGENIKRAVELKTHDLISGSANAGTPTETEEEKLNASAKKLIAGSGFEDRIF